MARTLDDIINDKKFDDAKENGGGKFALPGQYPEIEVTALKGIDASDGPAVVLEYDILKSNVPECPVGSGFGYVMKSKHQSFESNLKRCVSELSGIPFENVTRAVTKAMLSAASPLTKTKAALSAVQVGTKNSGGEKKYTKHNFRLIEKSPLVKQLEATPA